MSNHWDFHCHDCNEHAGARINHAEDELQRILSRRDVLAAAGDVDGLTVEIRGQPCMVPAWFRQHEGHKITVRSEYGYDFGDCAEYSHCTCCGQSFTCRLPKGHEGDHAPKKPA